MHVPWIYLSTFLFLQGQIFGQVPTFPLVWVKWFPFGCQKCEVRLVRQKKTGKWTQLLALFLRTYIWGGTGIFFPFWQRVCYQGQSASSQEYVCYFINMSSEKARLEDSVLACVYTWLHWKKCLRNKVSTIWGNCFEDDVKVERCLNSAEGGSWVTLLPIVFFLVNKTWHG